MSSGAARAVFAVLVGALTVSIFAVVSAHGSRISAEQPQRDRTTAQTQSGREVVYLTFDDGPSPRWTPKVLAVLRNHGAKATFFAVGALLDANPALARRVVREGHALGNHTYHHVDLTRLSAAQFNVELALADRAIRRVSRTRSPWLRPPYRAVDARTRSRAARLGYRIVLWDVDSEDWRRPGTKSIVSNVLSCVQPGAIVLMHDGGADRSQSVAALDSILDSLGAHGYAARSLAPEFAAWRQSQPRSASKGMAPPIGSKSYSITR